MFLNEKIISILSFTVNTDKRSEETSVLKGSKSVMDGLDLWALKCHRSKDEPELWSS